uniref:Uncharacterized protein n=1 Tax=Molossus molossus TaxID=27622 RepID=A0A7J8IA63_MOLMO|nr:hypothetical protein HJG59_010656 [Molossus molossus]
MTPCPGAYQSISGDPDPERTHLDSCCCCLLRFPPGTSPTLSTPKTLRPEDLAGSLAFSFPPRPPTMSPLPSSLLSSKGPSYTSIACFLSPFLWQITSSTSVVFQTNVLIIGILALNSFLVKTQVLKFVNPGPVRP